MKEINRRINFTTETGMACGPMEIDGCDAEIQLEDENGKFVYIHGQWCSESGEDLFFEITTVSIYDLLMKIHENFDNDMLLNQLVSEKERIQKNFTVADSGKYEHYFNELENMIWKEIADHGYEYDSEE